MDRALIALAAILTALAALSLAGRAAGVFGVGSASQGGPPLNPGAAVFFLAFAAAFVLCRERASFRGLPSGLGPVLARSIPPAIALAGALMWAATWAGVPGGEWVSSGSGFSFTLLGGALALRRRFPRIALALLLSFAALLFVILVWILYAIGSLLPVATLSGGAVLGILAYAGLVCGVLLLEPGRPPISVLVSDTPSGALARRMLPVLLLAPPLIGYIRLRGEVAGYFDTTVGVALFASALVGVFAVVLASTSRALARLDARRRAAEEEVGQSREMLTQAQRIGHVGSWDWDIALDQARWSAELFRIFGLEPSESGGDLEKALEMMHPEDRAMVADAVNHALDGTAPYDIEYRVVRPDGDVRIVAAKGEVTRDAAGKPVRMVGAVHDITDRKRTEAELAGRREDLERANQHIRASRARLESVYQTVSEVIFVLAVEPDGGYRFDSVNEAFVRTTGVGRDQVIGRRIEEVLPRTSVQLVLGKYREAIDTRGPVSWEETSPYPAGLRVGEVTVVPVFSPDGTCAYIVGSVHDITERTHAEAELAHRADELARSNAELEQFAYVASHDLQEPLRMVASYVQLLERRYQGKLDDDADEFIRYAVEGSNRMQALINDLLTFSRVGSRGKQLVPTEVGDALDVARQNLEVAIQESGAVITNDELPPARADPAQLGQLFQNLLANAIKFRGRDPPRVHVSGQTNGRWCEFTVKDNGIGIDPKYFDRIFLIFQRLHGREEYPGTGIGLAVCRRIVERHGGKIWVESAPGEGASFHFTVPSATAGAGG